MQPKRTDLLDRAKSGPYGAPPLRRASLPKGTDARETRPIGIPTVSRETRPIGIPTVEDKVLQRAVVMVLETIDAQDFLDGSSGDRPGRSAHPALDALWPQTMAMGGGWMVEVDIRQFLDTLEHAHLRELLKRRVRDGVLLRLIGKGLKAGVLEEGSLTVPEAGTPQGSVIAPLRANVERHEVLDVWFEHEVKPLLKGQAFLIRDADDFVMGFACASDARRVWAVLPHRLAKYGRTVPPDTTRRVAFQRPPPRPPRTASPGPARPGTLDLLGLTPYWERSRQGVWVVKRKTASGRWSRALQKIAQWCRFHRPDPMADPHHTLVQKLRGPDAYDGITGNYRGVRRFPWAAPRLGRKW